MDYSYKYAVATRCMTYNQAPFIEKTLQGFAIQKVAFPVVFVVVDDASTDGEQAVLKQWVQANLVIDKDCAWKEMPYGKLSVGSLYGNPFITFVLVLLKENHFQTGKRSKRHEYIAEWIENAKYIATCEGDDYWIDPHKLQIQVDYLEKHPNICFSCTRYKELNQKNGEIKVAPNYYFDNEINNGKDFFEFSRNDAFNHTWFTKSLTVLYRKDCVDWTRYRYFKQFRDVHSVYILLSKGNGVCHCIVSGVYRLNESSTFGGKSELEKICQNYLVYEELYKHTGDKLMKQIAAGCYVELFKNNYKTYGKPHNAFQYYVLFWFRPVLSIKRGLKFLLQRVF